MKKPNWSIAIVEIEEQLRDVDPWSYAFLVGGLVTIFGIFPLILGIIIIPIDFHIFQRGGPTTNQFFLSLNQEIENTRIPCFSTWLGLGRLGSYARLVPQAVVCCTPCGHCFFSYLPSLLLSSLSLTSLLQPSPSLLLYRESLKVYIIQRTDD